MGLAIDLRVANWIAHLIEPDVPVPRLGDEWEEREAVGYLLYKLPQSFLSTPQRVAALRELVQEASSHLQQSQKKLNSEELLRKLRSFMGRRAWTVLLIPSGQVESDRFICSEELLQSLVNLRPGCPGLILQPVEGSYRGMLTLTDVFPAFDTALSQLLDWPGMLIWTDRKQSAFLPFPSENSEDVKRSSLWTISQLGDSDRVDVEGLARDYGRNFPQTQRSRKSTLKIVHLSDMHLGSNEAEERLPRVHQMVRNTVKKINDGSRILPLVTGDLMDSPNIKNLNSVRLFMDFLSNLGTEPPITLLGNHDVREDGYLADDYRMLMRLPAGPAGVQWFDELGIGLVCFNSVMGGKLAQGFIGAAQLMDIGNAIDQKKKTENFTLVGVLHHHPVPVALPQWYQQAFYERLVGVFGRISEKSESLQDAETFLQFVAQRKMAALLHGHKHIPRINTEWNPQIPIYGCGSTVGKVKSKDGGAYMSLNVITVDTSRGRLSGRLLVERIAGATEELDRHEMIFGTSAAQ